MSFSTTKETILQRHRDNTLLNAPAPSAMMRGGKDLAADEAYAPLDEQIIAKTVEALEAGQTHYVDVPGIAPLREITAMRLNRRYGTAYQKLNLLITAGMQEARFLTIQMISEIYGRITVPAVVHPGCLRAVGVRPLGLTRIGVDERALPSIAGIRAALEAGGRLIYLESPSRLTGAAFSAGEVGEIAALLEEFDAAAIWDMGLAWYTEHYAALPVQAGGRVAAIGEAVPSMGIASWFIGFIAAPEAWIAPMQSQKQIMSICTSTPSQFAALEASQLADDALPGVLTRMKAARAAGAAVKGIDIAAGDAANIAAVRVGAGKAHALAALAAAGISVTDGAEFGAPEILRLTVVPDGTTLQAVSVIANSLSKGN